MSSRLVPFCNRSRQWSRLCFVPLTFFLLLVVLNSTSDIQGFTMRSFPEPGEPNDDFDLATYFDSGAEYVGYIGASDDDDYLKFHVGLVGQEIELVLSGPFGDTLPENYDLYLFNDTSGPAVASSTLSGFQSEQITFTADREGFWYVLVSSAVGGWSSESTYHLHLSLTGGYTPTPTLTPTPTSPYPDCPDSFEPNDDFAHAGWSIASAPLVSYMCAASDVDYFSIPGVTIGKSISVILNNLSIDCILTLYKPDQTVADYSNNSGTIRELISYNADIAGTWYVCISNNNSFSTVYPYTIVAYVNDCLVDGYEDNESWIWAEDLGDANFNEPGLTICPAGDKDWFKFEIHHQNYFFQATLTHDNTEGQLRFCLTDSTGQLNLSCSPGFSSTEYISWTPSTTGYYYLYVEGLTGDITNPDYTIHGVELSPTPTKTATPTITPTRTPTSTPTATPTPREVDIRAMNLVISQGLQDLYNSVNLVQRKQTTARLYFEGQIAQVPCSARLVGLLNGVALTPYVVQFTTAYSEVNPDMVSMRNQLGKSNVYCALPPSWFANHGVLSITAEVYPKDPAKYVDPNPSNNSITEHLTLEQTPRLYFQAVGIWHNDILPQYKDYQSMHVTATKMYPLGKIYLYKANSNIGWGGDYGTIAQLVVGSWFMKGHGKTTIYVGVVEPGASATADGVGCPTGHCWVKARHPDFDARCGVVTAHEAGHSLGMWHVKGLNSNDCVEAPAPHEAYPYPYGLIGNGNWDDYWGADTYTAPPQIKNPTDFFDIMSYCWDQWISDYTYNKLRVTLRNNAGLPVVKNNDPQQNIGHRFVPIYKDIEYHVVVGTIEPETSQADVGPVWTVDGADLNEDVPVNPEGTYSFFLLDEAWIVLSTTPFGLYNANHQEGGSYFNLLVEKHPLTKHIMITDESGVIFQQTISDNPPEGAIESLNWISAKDLEVTWSAFDPDFDPLTPAVMRSHDGGDTWELAHLLTEGNSSVLDTSGWPGSDQTKVAVRLTDGFHTVQFESDTFSVESKSPEVYILSLDLRGVYATGEAIMLQAGGFDPEDGPLDDEQLTWFSNIDGFLGTGETLYIPSLSEGVHQITLKGTDFDDNITEDQITLNIQPIGVPAVQTSIMVLLVLLFHGLFAKVIIRKKKRAVRF